MEPDHWLRVTSSSWMCSGFFVRENESSTGEKRRNNEEEEKSFWRSKGFGLHLVHCTLGSALSNSFHPSHLLSWQQAEDAAVVSIQCQHLQKEASYQCNYENVFLSLTQHIILTILPRKHQNLNPHKLSC